jgi:hypothetical protein
MFIEPYRKLKHVFDNEENAIIYLIENNYINKYDICNICNHDMKLYIKEKVFKCKSYNVESHFTISKNNI